MENILHELDLFNKVDFLGCLKNSNSNLFPLYLSKNWDKWIKISKVEIIGEWNTQFVYTLSFAPFGEDMEKDFNNSDLVDNYIWQFIDEFKKVIINHFEKLGYIQRDNTLIDLTNCYSKGFFMPSDNILTFIWITSLDE